MDAHFGTSEDACSSNLDHFCECMHNINYRVITFESKSSAFGQALRKTRVHWFAVDEMGYHDSIKSHFEVPHSWTDRRVQLDGYLANVKKTFETLQVTMAKQPQHSLVSFLAPDDHPFLIRELQRRQSAISRMRLGPLSPVAKRARTSKDLADGNQHKVRRWISDHAQIYRRANLEFDADVPVPEKYAGNPWFESLPKREGSVIVYMEATQPMKDSDTEATMDTIPCRTTLSVFFMLTLVLHTHPTTHT